MRFHLLLALSVSLVSTSIAQDLDQKIRGDLGDVLAEAAADELVPVTIVMESYVRSSELNDLAAGLDRQARREATVAHLKQVAADTQGDVLAYLASKGASNVKAFWIHNMVGAEVTPAVAFELASRPDVSYVHRNVRLPLEEVLSSMAMPAGSGTPTCGLELIRAPETWSQRGITGTGVTVGVIDTGMCASHSDINNRVWRNDGEIAGNGVDDDGNGYVDDLRGWNFDANNKNTGDGFGHGSHVAGTVAGDGTNGSACGVAPGARIMVLKINATVSSAGEQSVWEAQQYAVDNGADISTASLGWAHQWGPDRATWRAVIENSIASGMVVLYAAGNEGGSTNDPDNVRTPGDVPDVITVGSVNCNDQISSFSSRGPVTWENVPPYNDHPFPPGFIKPDVCAEGNNTRSHSTCGGYVTYGGTSMATPHVAGAAALILQADPTLDHFAVKAILEASAVDLGSAGKDNVYGWGRIDCLVAVDQAIGGGNFCAPKASSCGTVPAIWTEGNPRVSKDSGFVVNADSLPGNSVALMIYTDQGAGNTPILGGRLCIASILRGNPVGTGGTSGSCDGLASFDMNAFAAGTLGGTPAGFLSVPGTTVHCQWWARDAANSFGALLTGSTFYTVTP